MEVRGGPGYIAWMTRHFTSLGIVLFWAGMMAWLIRYEAYPSLFTHSLAGYGGLLADGPMLSDSWMKILVNGVHVGYAHSQMEVQDQDPTGRYVLSQQIQINLNLLGARQQVALVSKASLDVLYNLQRFNLAVKTGDYFFGLNARRIKENQFAVRIKTPAGRQVLKVELPGDAVIYSPMMELALVRLKPGQELFIKTLDPATLGTINLPVRALRRETLTVNGTNVETTVMSCAYGGVETLAWIDAEGRSIRQQTPLGWVFEASSPDEAIAPMDQAASALDLMKTLAGALPGLGIGAPPKAER